MRCKAVVPPSLPEGVVRWTPKVKEAVLLAIRGGWVDMAEAQRRWAVSVEELLEWDRVYRKDGLAGLKSSATRSHKLERR